MFQQYYCHDCVQLKKWTKIGSEPEHARCKKQTTEKTESTETTENDKNEE